MNDDMALLQNYAKSGSENAFCTLVNRHVDFVYSAALRQTQNSHLAEEITQVVFIILARKAGSISKSTILAGWLFRTTRFAANDALKKEIRRQRREQEAHMQSMLPDPESEPHWQQVSPLLDEAIAELGDKDRNAVLLRFFEKKNFCEVGGALGTNEETAKKRVSRAIEKLRKFFRKRGTVLPAMTLISVLSANSVSAAPVGLASTVAASAAIKGAVASGTSLSLLKGTLELMAWSKAKTAAIATTGVLLAATTAQVAVEHFSEPKDWRSRFEKAYRLSDGEVLKHIPSPFIPERLEYFRNDPGFAAQRNNSDAPTFMVLEQNGREIKNIDATWGGSEVSLSDGLCDLLKISRERLEGPEELLDLTLNGDWTVRAGTSPEKLLSALESIVFKRTGRKIHIERSIAERPAIVVRGRAATIPSMIDIYVAQKERGPGSSSGELSEFAKQMANWLQVPFVNEASTQPANARFRWRYFEDSVIHRMGNRRTELTDTLLRNLEAQTELSFSREMRRIEIWSVSQEFDEAIWNSTSKTIQQLPPMVIVRESKFRPADAGGIFVKNRVLCKYQPFEMLLTHAFNEGREQMVFNTPLPSGHFDYLTTMPQDFHEVLQEKIQEVFGIIGHREKRVVPVFVLRSAGANGSGLKANSGDSPTTYEYSAGHLIGTNVPLHSFSYMLQNYLQTPVVDETDLTQGYDIDLRWEHTEKFPPVNKPRVEELTRALREQLGLELTATERQIEMLIIEREQN